MKMLTQHYQAPQPSIWSGRDDSFANERFFQVVQCQDLAETFPHTNKESNIALLGFCCDEGVKRNQGRPGAALGPEALRKALGKLPLHTKANIYDVGDIVFQQDLESSQQALADVVQELLQHKITPFVIGGGHETAWGHYQGLARALPNQNIGIINFDAHFDLRPLINGKGSSGTPFLQIAEARKSQGLDFKYLCIGIQPFGNTDSLFKTADDLQVEYILAQDIHQHHEHIALVDHFIDTCDHIYLSICLDVFAQAIAPGVSAPQVLGLYPQQITPLLKHIIQSKQVTAMDIVELAPPFDQNDRTAQLAATIAAECINDYFTNQ